MSWTTAGVPHKDWDCIEVVDLGVGYHTCDMCAKEEIRYVHVMNHRETGDTKEVGCVCAAAMALESVADAKAREAKYKNMFKRRETFMKKWVFDGKYEKYKSKDGDYYTLYPQRAGGVKIRMWSKGVSGMIGAFDNVEKDVCKVIQWERARTFSSVKEAKEYVFDIKEGRVFLF